ncbi:Uma2 family endonuclease [Pendulispora brunnea]|uniref:Uma2 family endonuclease n=1 Tax=Pendulispora brunnea TaxID=2905690 RepID=A0ABZ2K4C4_9BACT
MAAAASLPMTPPFPQALPEQQRMLLTGISWKQYVIFRELFDGPGLRMTYCEGGLELMTTSRMHELWKKNIARLVELYALERDLPMVGYGSTTFQREAVARGVEPDECCRVGSLMKDGELPDIVLEVIYTNPLLNKLRVYNGLQVPEVWIFKPPSFELYRLQEGDYARIERSTFLPELDFELIARFATREDQHEALRELREILRK